jgi:Cu(I)/Ag(I) efflux system membrane protein CusA/SilA
MGGDLRLGILMQMEKVKWRNCVMRYGENADKVIKAVKLKMKLKRLPEGSPSKRLMTEVN